MSEPGGGSVSTAFLARLATRARLRRWSRTRTVVSVLVVVALVALLAWMVLGSSLLSTRSVEVRGATGSLAAQVHAVAEDEVGTPLARVDLSAVRRDVEAIRGIGEVTVRRDWPRTLRVEVALRKKVAAIRTSRGYDVVDGTGVVISTGRTRPTTLPLVVVGSGSGATLADGLAVLGAVPPKVAARTETVRVRTAQDIRLTLKNGDEIRWGSTADGDRKAAVLAALLKQSASVYDVRAPELPTTRR